jgi:hypothetical protein
MNQAHIFDIEVLITMDANVWIVSIENPSIPIIKLSLSEFNLIKKGIYKKYNCLLEINNTKYWLPENLYNILKVRVKLHKVKLSDLSFSLQEFINPNIIQHLDYKLHIKNIQHLKNRPDDIYIIASKNNEKNYKPIIELLEKELEKLGISIKKYYYLTRTFNNIDKDSISNNKIKICLQHLIGYKTDNTVFTNEIVDTYDRVYLYDDDLKTLEFGEDINNIFNYIKNNTKEEELTNNIKLRVKKDMPMLILSEITHNEIRPIVNKEILLIWDNVIKKFEGFRFN